MMKILSGITLFLLLSLNIFSQPVKIKFGIKAEMAFANSKIDNPINNFSESIPNKTSITGVGFF